jgi:hypothetical protein
MNQPHYKITISKPCLENWATMIPNEKGKHCLVCQKTVVDFTSMTDAQIIDYFQNYKGSTCGRFYETQLDIKTYLILKPNLKNRWAWVLSTLLLPLAMNAQTPRYKEPIKFEQSHKIKETRANKPSQKKKTNHPNSQNPVITNIVMGKALLNPNIQSDNKKKSN